MFKNVPELIIDFKDKATLILINDIGLHPDKAKIAAQKLAAFITKDWSGQQIYFPKYAECELSQRDIDLWNKFNGTNYAELAHEFKVSKVWVYKVVKFMRASETASKQIDAFPDQELQNKITRRSI